jgi:hypothetical protein
VRSRARGVARVAARAPLLFQAVLGEVGDGRRWRFFVLGVVGEGRWWRFFDDSSSSPRLAAEESLQPRVCWFSIITRRRTERGRVALIGGGKGGGTGGGGDGIKDTGDSLSTAWSYRTSNSDSLLSFALLRSGSSSANVDFFTVDLAFRLRCCT